MLARLYVPIPLAIGGVLLCASLFATWFDVSGTLEYSGFEQPSRSEVERVTAELAQSGWEFWDGGDVSLFVLGAGLIALAIYDAVVHRVPWVVLAVAAVLCAIALGVLLADGFTGDTVTLVEGSFGDGVGEARIARDRAGGQWVALIGLLAALIGLGLGWRERRHPPAPLPPETL